MTHMEMTDAVRQTLLAEPQGKLRTVLDTDTYNEIDDQFALIYALLSPEHIRLEAVYAAPFHNKRSAGPGDGMDKSYEEILRLLQFMGKAHEGFAFRGAEVWMPDVSTPVMSAAVEDLIARARTASPAEPLYVLAIGAITNVASALIAAPDIRDRVVVCWLGGHPCHWPHNREFNFNGDVMAVRALLASRVALVRFPCLAVAELLGTSLAEMERYVAGRGAVGDYLCGIFRNYEEDLTRPGSSKVIWDLAPVAWLVNPAWFVSKCLPCPALGDELQWRDNPDGHPVREIIHVDRDGVYADLFAKLAANCA